ncbi:uncharacterized protein RCO7_06576 [Rhynchosporium graminicola]|uniref:Uncharacterized protein n=1 Tax=Rhynchosporium graminicola TaxID=2792576 RepID=A0A1E1K9Y6_9HELO|nr:uncharacterized protein RCO7_06576 [Rhynchosporium commune]
MATTNASRVSDDLLSSLRSAVYDINIQLYSSIDRSSSSSTDQALLPTLAKLQDNFNSLSSLVSSTPQIQSLVAAKEQEYREIAFTSRSVAGRGRGRGKVPMLCCHYLRWVMESSLQRTLASPRRQSDLCCNSKRATITRRPSAAENTWNGVATQMAVAFDPRNPHRQRGSRGQRANDLSALRLADCKYLKKNHNPFFSNRFLAIYHQRIRVPDSRTLPRISFKEVVNSLIDQGAGENDKR